MQIHHWLRLLKIIVLTVPLLFLVNNPHAEAQGSGVSWSLNTKIAIPAQQIAGRGVSAAKAELIDSIAERMRNKGIPVEVAES